MYYLTASPSMSTPHLKTFYFLYKVQGELITRTAYGRTALEVALQYMPVIEVDTHPLKNSSLTILVKFDTKPTYAMIREQYPELLL